MKWIRIDVRLPKEGEEVTIYEDSGNFAEAKIAPHFRMPWWCLGRPFMTHLRKLHNA